MRLIAYRAPGSTDNRHREIGVVLGDTVARLTDIDAFYDNVATWTEHAATLSEGERALNDLKLAPPIPRDAKIICAAINYRKHGAESNLPTPGFPNLFARWTSELVGDRDQIPTPAAEPEGLDWEVELAAIVGKTLTDVDEKTALLGVLGYTVANDVSARGAQLQAASLSTGQWALGKNPEKSAAIASFIETADAIDPTSLTLETMVNDEIMQSGSTSDMIFSVGELIAFCSRHVTLRPGDVILTGTPDGVGFGRNPKIYMKPGSVVTCTISGIGSLTNYIVDAGHRG